TALNYLPKSSNETKEPEKVITDHWTDKFNELSRCRNEPWRKELLARALAAESENPGTVPPRVLWVIGTLEEEAFRSFQSILNICSLIGLQLMIPNVTKFIETPIDINNQALGLGQRLFQLNDRNIIEQNAHRK